MPNDADNNSEVGNLCGICRAAPATCHLCEIRSGEKTVLDLCDKCMTERGNLLNWPVPDLRGARCFYCGAAATGAGMNQAWERDLRGQQIHYTCSRCLKNQHDLTLDAFSLITDGGSAEEQMRQIATIIREVDEQVRAMARRNDN